MDDRISAYKTLLFLEKRNEDGECIDGQCHKKCMEALHQTIAAGELQHKQVDLKKFDGLLWIEFIGERMRLGNRKVEHYQEEMARGLPVAEAAYNFWLAYAKFYQILFDELGDMLCCDYKNIPRESAKGLEQAFLEFVEFSLKQ
jgi:hypothetical protein